MKNQQSFQLTYKANKPFYVKGLANETLQCVGFQLGVSYMKGSVSWFSGQSYPTGYYAVFTPLTEIEDRDGYHSVQFPVGVGWKDLIGEGDRFSKKKLDETFAKINGDMDGFLKTHNLEELATNGFVKIEQ